MVSLIPWGWPAQWGTWALEEVLWWMLARVGRVWSRPVVRMTDFDLHWICGTRERRGEMRTAAIADWFLWCARVGEGAATVTNMKLQKLVYLSESAYGSLLGVPLIDEDVQAWDHGPVVRPLYVAFKEFGAETIGAPRGEPQLPFGIVEVLESVWDYFGHMPASRLRKLTHDVGPYSAHYKQGSLHEVIPKDEIHAAWSAFLAAGSSDRERRQAGDERRALKNLLSVPTEQHQDFSVERLMKDYEAFSDLRVRTAP